jgi:hypothetical protein
MPLVLGCLALAFPRVVLILVWLFGSGYLGRAYESRIWPVLGFLFLPLTTLAFAFGMNSLGAPGEMTPLGWVLVVVAVLSDLGMTERSGRHARRSRRSRS